MNRRAYLSVTGLVLFAGCSSTDTTETPTSTTEVQTTETPAPTTTTTQTETPTQTTTEEPTTETPTETTTEELDRTERIFNLAVEDLDDAVAAFDDAGGPDGGFHDINATTNFSFDPVSGPLTRARGHLETLEQLDKTAEQRARLSSLWGIHWFLWWAGKTHENLRLARVRVDNAVSRFYTEEFYRIDSQVEQGIEALEPAKGTFDRLLDESNPDDLDAFDALTPDDYSQKVDALDTEIVQFEQFLNLLVSMRDAINRLQRGFDEYLGESYEDASGSFFRASLEFEDIRDELAELEPIVALETYVEDFVCVSDAMAQGSDAMDEAARAGDNDIPEQQPELEDEAKAAFDTCEVIEERLTFVSAFFEELPEQRT
ncbi:hypothetical protein [Haloferax sp. DFSO52]|uniref:hypothetical protein n=1 Tax=Haloferax sp. DFSO52 TaxID=3388505 RepID=UPI003A838A4A